MLRLGEGREPGSFPGTTTRLMSVINKPTFIYPCTLPLPNTHGQPVWGGTSQLLADCSADRGHVVHGCWGAADLWA